VDHGSLPSHPLSQARLRAGLVAVHGADLARDTEVPVPGAGAHARGRPGAAGAQDHIPLGAQAALMAAQEDMDHRRAHLGPRSLAHGRTAAPPWPRARCLRQVSLPLLQRSTARL
jgi:hypothetical protein